MPGIQLWFQRPASAIVNLQPGANKAAAGFNRVVRINSSQGQRERHHHKSVTLVQLFGRVGVKRCGSRRCGANEEFK
jgi:hypothetical protein